MCNPDLTCCHLGLAILAIIRPDCVVIPTSQPHRRPHANLTSHTVITPTVLPSRCLHNSSTSLSPPSSWCRLNLACHFSMSHEPHCCLLRSYHLSYCAHAHLNLAHCHSCHSPSYILARHPRLPSLIVMPTPPQLHPSSSARPCLPDHVASPTSHTLYQYKWTNITLYINVI